jgi:hypothetical protein
MNKSLEICKEILTEWPDYNRFLIELNKTSDPNRCTERRKSCGFQRGHVCVQACAATAVAVV